MDRPGRQARTALPGARTNPWPAPPRAKLLPDRFAVIALSGREPVNLAPAGGPARYVIWTENVTGAPECGGFDPSAPGSAWLGDLNAARAAGLAVSLAVPPGAPPIEQLVVVGVRTGDAAGPLAELLRGQAFSAGVEVLADGTPTNNSGGVRAAFSPERQRQIAGVLRDAAAVEPPAPAAGTGGAQVAGLLGLPAAALAALSGGAAPRAGGVDAARLLAGLALSGTATGGARAATQTAWRLLHPGGPAPALRVGRQPYGVLPATAPSRWVARTGENGAGVAAWMRAWGAAVGPVTATDPAAPPAPRGGTGDPRQITGTDLTPLLEAASPVRWAAAGAGYTGLDGLVGTADGPHSAAVYLPLVAGTAQAALTGIGGQLPDTLLAKVAVAAKRAAAASELSSVDNALRLLAGATRDDLARLFGEFLDAAAHRFDAWATGAATERLLAQRQQPSTPVVVGAYGWLTDVAPRTAPRSTGHVHAPSLGHAATAAVLRSAYLAQRAAQSTTRSMAVDLSSSRVRAAQWVLDAVRAGQPLAAVFGYLFERDLADAGLQAYLGAFRKLTRFRAGTALEQWEEARRARQADLRAAQARLAELQQSAAALATTVTERQEQVRVAGERSARAEAAAAPYAGMPAEASTLDTAIPRLQGELAAIDARRPAARRSYYTIQVP
ncbi:hypothetical protein Pflav_047710 [Phytohabitans flavus]|uniref:Uncharacterized protein n=1 Tax=Phytohabitans flavus TaxID=1076124 RepID=A0A6F8XXA1_9ACTN|nr:hypothetical protein [Phytohabitans flavus]BCB78361.1 hypothetical protein Pflav_047710 [Phytohabitans flavus]